ncbi:MAG: hypothetical protein GY702_16765, partial [Desulfobulbaceae bacterium]|nr:hypothetical protein [Desulfobulbaceae bacterium]
GTIGALLAGIAMTCQIVRGDIIGPLPACGMGAGIGMAGCAGSIG